MQEIQVIRMLPFQRNFSFGSVHSADEKHISTDTSAVTTREQLVGGALIVKFIYPR